MLDYAMVLNSQLLCDLFHLLFDKLESFALHLILGIFDDVVVGLLYSFDLSCDHFLARDIGASREQTFP